MNHEKYLNRIGIDQIPDPTVENLARLQRAHLFSVPYENLDILLKRPIALDAEALYEKIVTRRRGGYCFEVNELFGWLLRQLGYRVTDLFGRFLRGEAGVPMRRHHVLLVHAADDETPWLADVGVGTGSPTCPMRMAENLVQQDGATQYRLAKQDFFGWVLEEYKRGQWEAVYSFTEEAQAPIDFVAASFWCEHAPDSIFNRAAMVSLRTERGRRTMDGDEARVFEGDQVTVRQMESWAEKRTVLREWFGIELAEDERV